MNKIFWIIWFWFLYIAISLFVNLNSNNIQAGNTFLWEVFADITFDNQDPSKWYNADNPTASVYVTENAVPAPVTVTIITRHSH